MPNPSRSDQQHLDRAVVFADILGFSALTQDTALDAPSLRILDKPLAGSLDAFLGGRRNPLSRVFHGFHRSLRSTLDLARMQYPLTAITFSDSAFIATAKLFQAVDLAADLQRALLSQRIPVRLGIAYGSFAAVRFSSDVTDEDAVHAAHFLGTGVVFAHAAEACGIKGMRILLHPSAAALLNDPKHNPPRVPLGALRLLACADIEKENSADVQLEVDYWHFGRSAGAEAWRALQDMWTAAPQCASHHYRATAEAVDRMRVGQGKAPLAGLRRRTLPRERPPGV